MNQSGLDGSLFQLTIPDIFEKPLVYEQTDSQLTSDAGLGVIAALDRKVGLTQAVACSLRDKRDSSRVRHDLLTILRQRCYGIAAGYEDANDAHRLRDEPLLKTLLGTDKPLAVQATVSRFENSVSASELYRAADRLADRLLDHLATRHGNTTRVVIELDPTCDPTHGMQQLTLFNGAYDTHCYLPQLVFVTFCDKRGRECDESYLLAAVLRNGRAHATEGAMALLRRAVDKVRSRFGRAKILVRLDGGFASPEIYRGLEELGVKYVIAMGSNQRLEAVVEPVLEKVRQQVARKGETCQTFESFSYRADSWERSRRVVAKVEVTVDSRDRSKRPRDNVRFVVTNVYNLMPRYVYWRDYTKRAKIENRIKEVKIDGALGRSSCNRFLANQFRLLFAQIAYLLIQLLRLHAPDATIRRWQYGQIRVKLLKHAGIVTNSRRRTLVSTPRDGPYTDALMRTLAAINALN